MASPKKWWSASKDDFTLPSKSSTGSSRRARGSKRHPQSGRKRGPVSSRATGQHPQSGRKPPSRSTANRPGVGVTRHSRGGKVTRTQYYPRGRK